MSRSFESFLLSATQTSLAEKVEVIQELWSGYGEIARYRLKDSELETVIVKHIALGRATDHPRGWNTPTSHQRKVRSYEVETQWYKTFGKECDEACRIPKCFGVFNEDEERWIILEDLDKHYPLRLEKLMIEQAESCLKWLANFHATFMNEKPKGLWNIGTYWHLDTRPDELARLEEGELKSKAHLIDKKLNEAQYQTLIHGDAKLANFCFSKDKTQVAAVDFQYVGGGCGIKDVAYFLGSAFTSEECEANEDLFLDTYFTELKSALKKKQNQLDSDAVEEEWRELYPVACADFMRFMLGWMPTNQKVNDYYLSMLNLTLEQL